MLSDDCVFVDNACVLGCWEVSLELGVDSESLELVDRVDRDVAMLWTSRTTVDPGR